MSSSGLELTRVVDEKLKYLSQRHQALASNVANADAPGYKAKDVQKPDFRKVLDASVSALAAARTHPSHLAGNSLVPSVYPMVTRATTDELNPNGNNVSIEQEMQQVGVNASDYQLALGVHMSMDKLFNIALGQQSKSKK